MRTELMESALCWDVADIVTATYAKANESFSYFCPHPECLQEVGAERKVNAYFAAHRRHVPGCPNESGGREGKGTANEPAKKVSKVGPAPVPTELGAGKSRRVKKQKPSTAELLALAERLKDCPPSYAGTVEEVVNAWRHLTTTERRDTPLRINDEKLTYQSGFYCFAELGDSTIDQLPSASQIVYGTAVIEEDVKYYWIKSLKTFRVEDGRVKLILRIPKDDATGTYVTELLSNHPNVASFTLFYFGALPTLSMSRKSLTISRDISNSYTRFIMLADDPA